MKGHSKPVQDASVKVSVACPCGGGVYAHCCAPFHQGQPAPDAQRLMRSRYSAYVLGLEDYLRATWQAATRPADIGLDSAVKWLGLEVRRHAQQGDTAVVEFVARYKEGGRAHRLHETSRFVREQGRWLYVDGSFAQA
ncbi:MAG: YchJ family protein [Janthinobacterium lividum]